MSGDATFVSKPANLATSFNGFLLLNFAVVGSWFAIRPTIMGHQPGSWVFAELLIILLFVSLVSRLSFSFFLPQLLTTLTLTGLTFRSIASFSDLSAYGYGSYWGGFGQIRGAAALLVSLLVVGFQLVWSHHKPVFPNWTETAALFLVRITAVLLLVYLLPSTLQPMDGWLNLGDGTQYVLEDLTGWVAGNIPGVHITATYHSLLGAPLLLLKIVNLQPSDKIVVVGLYANLLAIGLPLLIAYLIKRLYPKLPFAAALAMAISSTAVSGDSVNTSLVQELSPVTRLLAPIALCVVTLLVLAEDRTASRRRYFLLGLVAGAVAFNNYEYGIPALAASLVALIVVSHDWKSRLRRTATALLGVTTVAALILVGSWLINPQFFQFRLGIFSTLLSGGPTSKFYTGQFPGPSALSVVPLTLIVSISILATALRSRTNQGWGAAERVPAVVTMFMSTFVVLGMPHCLNLSCGRGGHTVTAFVPQLFLLGASTLKLLSADLKAHHNGNFAVKHQKETYVRLSLLPLYMISSLGLVAITQAPSSLREWRRIQVPAMTEQAPNEFSYRKLDYVEVREVSGLAEQFGGPQNVGYLGIFGNAIQVLTGLEYLWGANSIFGYEMPTECKVLSSNRKQFVVTHRGGDQLLRQCKLETALETISSDGFLSVHRILGAEKSNETPSGVSDVKIVELSVCDGTDAGTVADEMCKIGMTGPGGGLVFFIDYYDQYASFCEMSDCNYLEASPTDVGVAQAWCSNPSSLLGLNASSNTAIGMGSRNTATADTACTSGAIQTATDYTAPSYNGVVKDDWWLPSLGELMAMYWFQRQFGDAAFTAAIYWSSSEFSATGVWNQDFSNGRLDGSKELSFLVRPVRGF